MTETQKNQGIIIGSSITFSMFLMSRKARVNATTIRLRDKILSVTTTQGNDYIKRSADLAWQMTIDDHSEEKLSFSVAVLIESLTYSYLDIMQELYGKDILNLVDRFVAKQSVGNISDYAKESYTIADSLRDNCRKALFDLKDK